MASCGKLHRLNYIYRFPKKNTEIITEAILYNTQIQET